MDMEIKIILKSTREGEKFYLYLMPVSSLILTRDRIVMTQVYKRMVVISHGNVDSFLFKAPLVCEGWVVIKM